MINLELYKIFVFVAKEGNITKASEKLNISQPAVTKHIKNLEEQLGVTLFKRNKYDFLNRIHKKNKIKCLKIRLLFLKISSSKLKLMTKFRNHKNKSIKKHIIK